MIVEGAIVDSAGPRTGYLRIRQGRVEEVGLLGTDSSHGKERRVRGIVVPAPVNAHTHLGDSGYGRRPPSTSLAEVVGAPGGEKFRFLAEGGRRRKRTGITESLRRMSREGVAGVIDFREEGLPGVRLLRAAARSSGPPVTILGRPLRRPVDPAEVAALLAESEGIGLSSAREEPPEVRRPIADACRARGKLYALHASEETREPPESFLEPRPDLLVHLLSATEEDLATVAAAQVPVAVCPRSNALFGRTPDLSAFERQHVRMLLGTDNGMLNAPSLLRELEFAYVGQRLLRHPVSPEYLVRAAFLEPWSLLGHPERAQIATGSSGPLLVLRLPIDDPEYALVARSTEAVIVRPEGAPPP